MKINRMHIGAWGKVRAFFDIKTQDGFIIKGFKLIESEGLFVGFPSSKDKDGEYVETISADKQLKQQVNKLAHDHYNDLHKEETESNGNQQYADDHNANDRYMTR